MTRTLCFLTVFLLLLCFSPAVFAQSLDEAAATPTTPETIAPTDGPGATASPTPAGARPPAPGSWLQKWIKGSQAFITILEGVLEQLARLFGIQIPFPRPAPEEPVAGNPGTETSPTGPTAAQPGASGPLTPGSETVSPDPEQAAPVSSPAGNLPGPSVSSGPDAGTIGIPPRPANARGGRAFIESTNRLTRPQREVAIFEEISQGNVPEFARQWKTIQATFTGRDGQAHTVRYQVLPDYLCIGSNDDFIRIPMDPHTAQRLADLFGAVLPTRKMVNDIYSQATLKLSPQPKPPGAQMMSSPYYLSHQEMVERQRAGRGLGELTAGHKKDVVITNMLDRSMAQGKRQVAIYGWHQQNGRPIQPLSTIHESTYADYSHGVRLVNQTVNVDGSDRPIGEVLADAQLWRLLSDEGQLRNIRAHR